MFIISFYGGPPIFLQLDIPTTEQSHPLFCSAVLEKRNIIVHQCVATVVMFKRRLKNYVIKFHGL